MKKIFSILCVSAALLTASCTHKEDPFVDRVVSPVLIVFDNAVGDGGGQTAEPTVTSKATGAATIKFRIYKLDKTNILDYTKGIDSIPVTNLTLKLTTRSGAAIGDMTTDASGVATITKSWSEFGVTTPQVGTIVPLTLTGKQDDQVFSKLARLQAN